MNSENQVLLNGVEKLSKKALKKLERKKNDTKTEPTAVSQPIEEDISANFYGTRKFCQGRYENFIENNIIVIGDLNESRIGETVQVKGFVHQVRKTGKQAFLVLRQQLNTIQCVCGVDDRISKQMIKFIGNISKESVVDIRATVVKAEKPVESCTKKIIELNLLEIFVLSAARSRLNLQIEDAMRSESDDSALAKVTLDTRLNNRCLDLRTPANQAIFSIEFEVMYHFIDYLRSNGFTGIFVPHTTHAAPEGGANVFQLKYFTEFAYLTQSPQLYKQMAISGGFRRVFTATPVFRAENSNTHRHLTEFFGLDIEMEIDRHYHEAVDVLCRTMVHIFRSIEKHCKEQIAAVSKQFPAEPFQYLEPTLVLTFCEGVDMLREAGVQMEYDEDLSTANEKLLGKLIRKKFGTDFYVLDRFPTAVRPFYTKVDENEPAFSHSYDFFMRGEEILSGAQRIHDAEELRASALRHGIDLETLRDYLESFENGCSPHAGGGIGLERVVMLYLGLDDIRRASMFPRDPRRLRP